MTLPTIGAGQVSHLLLSRSLSRREVPQAAALAIGHFMLAQPEFALTEATELRTLLRNYPWATLVSSVGPHGLIASHLPIVLSDPQDENSTSVSGHLAAPDARRHELGEHDALLICQGPHGYISPTMYEEVPHVPTWNFVVIHLYGRPRLLDPVTTYRVLEDTVDHLESRHSDPWKLTQVQSYAERIAPGTTGFRLDATHLVGKAKLSQDLPADEVGRLAHALRHDRDGMPANPLLADAMLRAGDLK